MELRAGTLRFRKAAVESFALEPGEMRFDIAVAVRVGALDGRHPELEVRAKERVAAALVRRGRLFIDGGDPLLQVRL